jgi:hypothetical protein
VTFHSLPLVLQWARVAEWSMHGQATSQPGQSAAATAAATAAAGDTACQTLHSTCKYASIGAAAAAAAAAASAREPHLQLSCLAYTSP